MKKQSLNTQLAGAWRHWFHPAAKTCKRARLTLAAALAIVAAPAQAQLPTPIIDVGFNEATGTVVTNNGSAGGTLTRSTPSPYWTNNVPIGPGGLSAIDYTTTTGNFFVESPTNYPQLTNLTKFTLAGWVNCRSSTVGNGGNRILTWINGGGNGVDLVVLVNGNLRIGINQWPDATSGTTNSSSNGMIPADAAASPSNWRFFAVTYDSTLASGHLSYYFGNSVSDAALDVKQDYSRGVVQPNIMRFCIGHFNSTTRSGAQDRMFRGLMDEIKVYGDALTPQQIIAVQRAGETPRPAGFAAEPKSLALIEAQPASFTAVVTGTAPILVQWQINSNDIAGANGLTYSIPATTTANNGEAYRVVLSNQVGGVIVSSNAILTVAADTNLPTVLSIVTGRNTRTSTNLTINFSEPVETGSAQELGNYIVSGGVTTYAAVLQPNLRTVSLLIDPLTPGTPYNIQISGVTDRAGIPNLMNGTNIAFTGPPMRLPPVIAVHMEEGTGTNIANSGTAGGFLTMTAPLPAWNNNVAFGLGSFKSLDFGATAATTPYYYAECPTNYPQLGGLTKFTISGWVNNRSSTEGGGGNRIVAWNNAGNNGVDLVYHSDGSLQAGINQFPDNTPARSSAAMITTDSNAGSDNWRFFAMTYDSTLPTDQVKFYFGTAATDATLDVSRTYSRGAVGNTIQPLVIGNFNKATRANPSLADRMFRGLIDDVQVFDDALTLQEIITEQRPGGTGTPAGFSAEPVSQSVLELQPVSFSVVITGAPPLTVQWQRNSNDISGANSLSYSIPAASINDNGAAFRAVVSNQLGQVTSSNAILTVIPDLTAPTVLSVTTARSAKNLTNITVTFSEPVDTGTAEELGGYLFDVNTTYSAVLQADLKTVILTVDPLTPGATHVLMINGVTDRSSAHNVMTDTNWIVIGPPVLLPPIVETRFEEGSGTLALNSGTLGGSSVIAQQSSFPAFSVNVPVGAFAPAANFASIDFGQITATDGARSIDLTTANGPGGTIGAMQAFTICGWVNARDLTEGPGGNRIVFALGSLNGPGFDLVQLNTGALRLGVNQWPDGGGAGGPFSSTGKITVDPLAGANNWVFFAVTYDSAVGGGEARYYFGKPDQAATLDVAAAYARGSILTSGTLSAGNFSTVDVPARTAVGGSSRVFRGLMDEVQVFDDALSIQQIQMIQLTTPAAPKLTAVRDANELVISWQSPVNYQLQFKTNITQATWDNEPTSVQVSGNSRTVRLPMTGVARYYRLKSQ